jgi:hypothetical protein
MDWSAFLYAWTEGLMSKQPISQFHVTRQLGFKPILYCWCGANIDTNKNSWQALRKFKMAHEGVCEMQISKRRYTPRKEEVS